nr:MAG TPA: hypothetical protein [Caudoviricetes sp.]
MLMLLVTRIVAKKSGHLVSHVLLAFPWNCNEKSEVAIFCEIY